MSQKFNQLILPHSHITDDNFKFFSKGRELWNIESQFKEDLEDKIRNQLEISDLL
jgi:t-SNARE complex subunit (syntaxin)